MMMRTKRKTQWTQRRKTPTTSRELKMRTRRRSRFSRSLFQFALLLALGIAFALPAAAQDKKSDAQLRTIRGTVLDKDETPRPSGVVYLLNVKTQAVKTYIADDAGNYRFSGLDPNVDYEVHAEHEDMTSRHPHGFEL